jgi:hypothetical protein
MNNVCSLRWFQCYKNNKIEYTLKPHPSFVKKKYYVILAKPNGNRPIIICIHFVLLVQTHSSNYNIFDNRFIKLDLTKYYVLR